MALFTVVAIVALVAGGLGLAVWMIRSTREKRSVAFFHPNCLSRGGGEFVLWAALATLARDDPSRTYVIYTGTAVHPSTAVNTIERAVRDFGLAADDPELAVRLAKCVRFVHVRACALVFRPYRCATLLLQCAAGALAGLEALWRYTPEVFIETTGGGCAFALPVFRYIGGCTSTLAYVHYPTITSKMAADVAAGDTAAVCNRRALTPAQTARKLRYYRAVARLYRFAGGAARLAMANGSWTAGHLRELWPATRITTVFPPCTSVSSDDVSGNVSDNVSDNVSVPAKDGDPLLIVSIGQYRPEKRHLFQVNVMSRLLLAHPEHMGRVRLVLIGSVRGPEDAARRAEVERAASLRGLVAMGAVEMPEDVNAAQKALYLRRAAVGLHCMADEHFGICVVEYMAAGAVPLAHDSAGPRLDIVVPALRAADCRALADPAAGASAAGEAVGMLATTEEEYAECLHTLLSNAELREGLARRAMLRARTFSVQNFEQNFRTCVTPFLTGEADLSSHPRHQ